MPKYSFYEPTTSLDDVFAEREVAKEKFSAHNCAVKDFYLVNAKQLTTDTTIEGPANDGKACNIVRTLTEETALDSWLSQSSSELHEDGEIVNSTDDVDEADAINGSINNSERDTTYPLFTNQQLALRARVSQTIISSSSVLLKARDVVARNKALEDKAQAHPVEFNALSSQRAQIADDLRDIKDDKCDILRERDELIKEADVHSHQAALALELEACPAENDALRAQVSDLPGSRDTAMPSPPCSDVITTTMTTNSKTTTRTTMRSSTTGSRGTLPPPSPRLPPVASSIPSGTLS
jgi:hypothetical protein